MTSSLKVPTRCSCTLSNPWDWDDTTSVAIADPRLEGLRPRLGPNLDSLAHESHKDELRAIIAALRRGEQP